MAELPNEQSDGIDLSGLGGAAGQLTPHRVPYWEMVGTDEMKLSRMQMPIRASENRPSFNELEVCTFRLHSRNNRRIYDDLSFAHAAQR